MARLKAEHLTPGMVVARDVKNIDGMMLIPAGAILTERQIGILQAWGVSELEIEGGDSESAKNDPLARLTPEQLAQLTADLKARYWTPDHIGTVEMEIFKLMLHRQALRLLPR